MRAMPNEAETELARSRRPLIFGGSFDPPHRAHVELPRLVAEAIDADLIVYVPAGRAPHKLDRKQTDPMHRLAMLRRAVEGIPDAVVWPGEIERAGDGRPSYTVETLETLRGLMPIDAVPRLLIGSDQVAIFETWKDWRRIVELAEPVVMVRPPDRVDDLPAAWRGRVVELPAMDVSSTRLREAGRVGWGQDLAPGVAGYIEKHGLYR